MLGGNDGLDEFMKDADGLLELLLGAEVECSLELPDGVDWGGGSLGGDGCGGLEGGDQWRDWS